MKLTLALCASTALALTACSGAEDNPGPEPANMESPAPANGNAVASAENLGLKVAEAQPNGRYLTDSGGRAVYMMAPGGAEVGPDAEAQRCTGPCLTDWPPVPASATAGQAIQSVQSGSVSRDGGGQLTVNGFPLYYYTADRDAGQISGHLLTGDYGTWHLVSPDGKPILEGPQRSKAN